MVDTVPNHNITINTIYWQPIVILILMNNGTLCSNIDLVMVYLPFKYYKNAFRNYLIVVTLVLGSLIQSPVPTSLPWADIFLHVADRVTLTADLLPLQCTV